MFYTNVDNLKIFRSFREKLRIYIISNSFYKHFSGRKQPLLLLNGEYGIFSFFTRTVRLNWQKLIRGK